MKIKAIKEVEIKNPRITIRLDPDNNQSLMTMEYTCQDCAGYGCRSHGGTGGNPDCRSGSCYLKLEPSQLNTVFDPEFVLKITNAISKLFSEMMIVSGT